MDMNLSKLWELMEDRGSKQVAVPGVARVRHDLATEQQPPQQKKTLHCILKWKYK